MTMMLTSFFQAGVRNRVYLFIFSGMWLIRDQKFWSCFWKMGCWAGEPGLEWTWIIVVATYPHLHLYYVILVTFGE